MKIPTMSLPDKLHTVLVGSAISLSELEKDGYQARLTAGLDKYEAEAGKTGSGYFTFLDDGYRHRIVTLIVSEKYPDYIPVSAYDNDMLSAVRCIEEFNPHLRFARPADRESLGSSDPESKSTHKLFFEVQTN